MVSLVVHDLPDGNTLVAVVKDGAILSGYVTDPDGRKLEMTPNPPGSPIDKGMPTWKMSPHAPGVPSERHCRECQIPRPQEYDEEAAPGRGAHPD